MGQKEALPFRYMLITNMIWSQAISFYLSQRATTMDLPILCSNIMFAFKRKEDQLDGI
jgi:hypothetical protein